MFQDVASVIPYGKRFICFAFNGIYRKRFGRSKPLPYNKRCRGFVGVDIYDDPR